MGYCGADHKTFQGLWLGVFLERGRGGGVSKSRCKIKPIKTVTKSISRPESATPEECNGPPL